MITNSKSNCINDISASMARTAIWRRGLQAKYSNDVRNGQAADVLKRFADEINDLSDEQWLELKPYYSWSSGEWSEAVSQTSRLVGFRGANTLADFVNHLVGILSQSSVAS
jgi:hypothetical protein